ncbi:hypothetical protein [Rhodococcus sp. BP-241]|uniref:hypothetical protein n=1 Tax=Rhodococcus sp. BP-241 TaxID=2739441 RepID=UPI0021BFA603|nr:hypothetical protein [Rhodococcus sp. BP-241]
MILQANGKIDTAMLFAALIIMCSRGILKLKTALVAAVAASLALAGCGGGGGTEKAPGADGETTATSLMLNWYPYGEHAPFYYGGQEGIFAKHGIDLTITAGQG